MKNRINQWKNAATIIPKIRHLSHIHFIIFVLFRLPDDDEASEAEEVESRGDANKGSQARKSLAPFLAPHFKRRVSRLFYYH